MSCWINAFELPIDLYQLWMKRRKNRRKARYKRKHERMKKSYKRRFYELNANFK